MVTRTCRTALVLALAVLGLTAAAPAAQAGTIRYTIAESPLYTIEDNGNGIVKVTYNGCVVAGERQTLQFTVVTEVSGDSNATFNVLRAEGAAPTASFDPATLFLRQGPPQSSNVALSFSVAEENNDVTTFRFKLDPESGEGLGQGAGVMVNIPCVLRAANAPLPAAPSTQASQSAPCISTQTLRVRAGRTRAITVRVTNPSGQRIANALVRATGPGFVRTARTNENGTVTFRVRPSRSGTIFLQSEVCTGADRVRVLRALPRFTG